MNQVGVDYRDRVHDGRDVTVGSRTLLHQSEGLLVSLWMVGMREEIPTCEEVPINVGDPKF